MWGRNTMTFILISKQRREKEDQLVLKDIIMLEQETITSWQPPPPVGSDQKLDELRRRWNILIVPKEVAVNEGIMEGSLIADVVMVICGGRKYICLSSVWGNNQRFISLWSESELEWKVSGVLRYFISQSSSWLICQFRIAVDFKGKPFSLQFRRGDLLGK